MSSRQFQTAQQLSKPRFNTLTFLSGKTFSTNLPKHTKLAMPALSPTMKKGKIQVWNKKVGEKLSAGDVLAEVETDKATVGFEMQEEAYLAKILVQAGEKEVNLGEIIAILVDDPADVAKFANFNLDAATAEAPKASPPQAPAPPAPSSKPAAASSGKTYPKHNKLTMPALSPTMKKGKIQIWNKKVGDKLSAGDVLAEVETDKATVGFEMQEEAFLAKILVQAGEKEVNLGEVIAITVDDQADVAKFADFTLEAATGSQPQAPAAAQQPLAPSAAKQTVAATVAQTGDRVFASPLARKVAKETSVELQGLKGSGPNGRIIESDVRAAASSPKPAQAAVQAKPAASTQAPSGARSGKSAPVNPFVEIPVTSVRAVIAERLLEAKRNVPHFYLTIDVIMDELLKAREALNKSAKIKLSVTDILVKACANACIDVPEVNSQFHGNHIKKFKNADIAVAVSYEGGLITPIVHAANTKGLNEIAANTKDLIERARKSALQPHEFIGGTFTISNLGMFGISQFSAIINPPQSCILAVSKTEKKFLVDDKNPEKPKIAQVMCVTLSCDHRVVDGAIGAQWLQKFKNYLENPISLLL